jgi:phospholipid N-methyltransferase
MLSDHISFLSEFIRRPKNTGAVAPSSRWLAETIVEDIGLETASLVVEYGPGTGAFTGKILESIGADADFIAIENNERMRRRVRDRFPDVDVADASIEDLPKILENRGHAPGDVDAIVSGLPWAAFGESLQDRLLNVTESMLSPRGRFATFAYIHGLLLPAGRRFREKLNQHFGRVSRSSVVWRNLPPAFVYRCSGRN